MKEDASESGWSEIRKVNEWVDKTDVVGMSGYRDLGQMSSPLRRLELGPVTLKGHSVKENSR